MTLISNAAKGAGNVTLNTSKVSLTSGDLSTASTSFVDATGVTVTVTTGANPVLITFSGGADNSTASAYICLDLMVDGVRQGGTFGLTFARAGSGGAGGGNTSFSFVTAALAGGSHTFKIQWRVTAGTGTFYASATAPAILSVIEL